jgi:hypothetical protein
MAPRTFTPELDARFSAPDAAPTPWADVDAAMRDAELFWISTVRADGRPHVASRHHSGFLAEADGNRTRPARLSAAPVLKFGGGRVSGCDLVPAHPIQSTSAATFVLPGALL